MTDNATFATLSPPRLHGQRDITVAMRRSALSTKRSRGESKATAGLVVLALCATGCSLDFRRFAPDAAREADVAGDALDRVVPTDVPRDDGEFDAMPDVGPIDADAGPPTCGERLLTCCNGTCANGIACVNGYCGCGGSNEACCIDSFCASTATACVDGMCVPCGAELEPCCTAGPTTCDSGLECNSGTCRQRCGAPNAPCCGTSCDVGATCLSGTCVACGTNGAMCCPGATCAQGYCDRGAAAWQSGRCYGCGALGQFCCEGHVCGAGNCLVRAHDDVCVTTGSDTVGGACDPGIGPYCGDGSECGPDGICYACGGYLEACCNGTSCNAGLACLSATCR